MNEEKNNCNIALEKKTRQRPGTPALARSRTFPPVRPPPPGCRSSRRRRTGKARCSALIFFVKNTVCGRLNLWNNHLRRYKTWIAAPVAHALPRRGTCAAEQRRGGRGGVGGVEFVLWRSNMLLRQVFLSSWFFYVPPWEQPGQETRTDFVQMYRQYFCSNIIDIIDPTQKQGKK